MVVPGWERGVPGAEVAGPATAGSRAHSKVGAPASQSTWANVVPHDPAPMTVALTPGRLRSARPSCPRAVRRQAARRHAVLWLMRRLSPARQPGPAGGRMAMSRRGWVIGGAVLVWEEAVR